MELDAKKKPRMAALNEEMDVIHSANQSYWNQGQSHSARSKAHYQFRQERLEEIRKELAQLRSFNLTGMLG
jgi:hypothetical protein